jgi:hypothetical protein
LLTHLQNHHIDLGVVLLPNSTSSASASPKPLVPYFRFAATSYLAVPPPVLVPIHSSFPNYTTLSDPTATTLSLYLEVKANNLTHYAFSAGPVDAMSDVINIGYAPAADVSFGFTGMFYVFDCRSDTAPMLTLVFSGTILGVYATTNGRDVNASAPGTPAYISDWKYTPQGQFLD